MKGMMTLKRLLTQDSLNQLYLEVLNRRFEKALATVRTIPMQEMDYAFLQTYLSRSCHWGHMESVSHIWYKYVSRYPVLTVSPELLCNIGNLALNEDKHFIPSQLYFHYKKFHVRTRSGGYDPCEYELLRIKVESFAKGTMFKTKFREKWKVYLQDMDNQMPSSVRMRVRDFPFLTKSMAEASKDEVMGMLFTESRINIRNESTLTLLLNMFLLQPHHHIASKISSFQSVSEIYESLNYDDSYAILFQQCGHDGYRLSKLMDYAMERGIAKLSPVTSRVFLKAILDSEYNFKVKDYADLLTGTPELLISGQQQDMSNGPTHSHLR